MKNILFLILSYLMVSSMLSAQQYNHTYVFADDFIEGDPIEVNSQPYSMLIDPDGATVSVHNITEGSLSPQPTAHNVEILKVDINGNVLWSKRIGGEGYDDRANAICHTDDGGYLIVGSRGKIKGAYRGWVFRLDVNGTLLWERLYFQKHLDSESLLVKRTFEIEENYFIAGHTFPSHKITAMKISANGHPYWHNRYSVQSSEFQPNKLVTSMVHDTRNNGYAIAGLEFVDRKKNTDLFTIGIDLNGNVYRDYQKYGLPFVNVETEPHIIENIEQNAFVMAFGSNPAYDQLNATIAIMPLSHDLMANGATLYNAETERKERPNSIYADPNGFYALGCIGSDDSYIINGSDDRPSFLRIDIPDQIGTYLGYNVGVNASCTFMAQDLTNGNYVLKTDLSVDLQPAAGLIQTALDGHSACSVIRENIIPVRVNVMTDRKYTFVQELSTKSLNFPSETWNMDASPINCVELVSGGAGASQRESGVSGTALSADLTAHSFIAYPSLLMNGTSEFTLEFSVANNEEVAIKIVNPQGQLVEQLSYHALKGINTYTINTDKLALGVNTILLINKDNTSSHTRVIKF